MPKSDSSTAVVLNVPLIEGLTLVNRRLLRETVSSCTVSAISRQTSLKHSISGISSADSRTKSVDIDLPNPEMQAPNLSCFSIIRLSRVRTNSFTDRSISALSLGEARNGQLLGCGYFLIRLDLSSAGSPIFKISAQRMAKLEWTGDARICSSARRCPMTFKTSMLRSCSGSAASAVPLFAAGCVMADADVVPPEVGDGCEDGSGGGGGNENDTTPALTGLDIGISSSLSTSRGRDSLSLPDADRPPINAIDHNLSFTYLKMKLKHIVINLSNRLRSASQETIV